MSDATAAALLSTEGKALAAMRQAVSLYRDPRDAAPLLISTVEQARALARREGARTMTAEVRQPLPALPALPDVDRKYAERAVAGYLKALDGAAEKRAAGETASAARVVEVKLNLIAATEVPGAFGEERERIERRVVADNPSLIPILLKTWNARLDRACPVCRGLHRTARPWGVDFDGKQPGRAHNNCRCFATYMPIGIGLRGGQQLQQRREGGLWEWYE